ncbi:hypothetical protein SDC9_158739 [bioreactor metagenome]|uniref:Uncharacterized protein n=1 Tax=bioreactor metagenome TaxID=1076179 RepID=A0A645FAN6_9ZZZZ
MHNHRAREILRVVVRGEVRVAHQIAHGLHQVALEIETEMRLRHLVAPFDLTALVQQHHAVGRGLQRRQNIVQARIAGVHL